MKIIKSFVPLILLLVLYFFYSFITYKDYGISTDEPVEYKWGKELAEHIGNETKYENTIVYTYEQEPAQRRHTPVLSKYNRWYPALISVLNKPGFYERAHFINMSFFSLLLVSVYISVYLQYKKAMPAFISSAFVLMTPLLFGNAPINPKDMPFAVMYFLSISGIYISSKHLKDPFLKIIFLSFLFALTQGMRIIGFSLYFIFFIYEYLSNKKIPIFEIFIIFCVSNFFMIWWWPNLGINYLQNFYHILIDAQKYEFWDKSIFYLGQYIGVEDRPWHYLLILISVTTPLYILILFMTNLVRIKHFLNNDIVKLSWIVLGINFSLYLILHPTIYNGIRHFLYLLTFISLLAGITFYEFLNTKFPTYVKTLLILTVIVNNLLVMVAMYKIHPYEYMYFNEIVAGTKGAQKYFEVDYWNLSYKEAFEWALENNYLKDDITNYVYVCNQSEAIKYYSKIAGIKVITNWKNQVDEYVELCDYNRAYDRGYELTQNNPNLLNTITKNGIPLNYILIHQSQLSQN